MQEHLDADAGQGAALGELEIGKVGLEEFEFGGIPRPEGQREGRGAVVLVLNVEDLAVLTGPKLIGGHGCDSEEKRGGRLAATQAGSNCLLSGRQTGTSKSFPAQTGCFSFHPRSTYNPHMKLKSALTFSLLALGTATAIQAQEVKLNIPGQPAAAAAAPVAPVFTEAQLVETFGWFMGKRIGLSELAFSPAEVEALLKGMGAAVSGKDSPYELEKIGPAMDEFMKKKQDAYMGKLKQEGLKQSSDFFAKLKENKAVVELPSGLRYEVVKQGDGAAPNPTETVKVHYTGTLIDGTVFDSSVQRNEPAEFQLDQVIPGWTEGLQKVNKGGKIKLYVPPSLAYGDDARGNIPPSSTLIFEIDLLDIKPSAPAPAMPVAPAAGK